MTSQLKGKASTDNTIELIFMEPLYDPRAIHKGFFPSQAEEGWGADLESQGQGEHVTPMSLSATSSHSKFELIRGWRVELEFFREQKQT